ncbi:MAG: hypothetical protein RL670_811, partial [Actinomycetota bacterium]
ITKYNVTRSTSATGTFTAVTAGTCSTLTTAGTCTVTGLTNGTKYYFKVSATNAVGTSAVSAASAAITPATLPGAPTGLKLTKTRAGTLSISWAAPASNGGSPIVRYEYCFKTSTATIYSSWTSLTTSTSFSLTGLLTGTTYNVQIRAVNAVGVSAAVLGSGTP